MNKNEYISRLAKGIEKYHVTNKYDILADYEQIVDEILLDNDNDFNAVIDKLGYPEILALEIVQELGCANQKVEPEPKRHSDQSGHVYQVKRQKSNVVWNILMAFFYIFQSIFSLIFIIIIGLGIYFGFDSTVSKSVELTNNQAIVTMKICRQADCKSYVITVQNSNGFNYQQNNNLTFESCQKDSCPVLLGDYNFTLPLGIIIGGVAIVTLLLIWLNYLIMYKNLKSVIRKNNEYNRRRNYE